MPSSDYGGIIWTKHALKRLKERQIPQGEAWLTWRRPDSSRWAASKGAFVFQRTYQNQKVELVAKRNERGQWLALSVWARPARQRKTGLSWWQRLLFWLTNSL